MFLPTCSTRCLIGALVICVSPLSWAQSGTPSESPSSAAPTAAAPLAQPSAEAGAPTATEVVGSAAPASAQHPPETVEEARRRFDRGLKLYGEGDYGLALIEFERAYELVANYRVLYNIGQVGIQLRRYARAREALEQYLARGQGEVDGTRLLEVQADIEMLKSRTAKLMVTTNVGKARVFLDGEVLGNVPLASSVLVDAGNHIVKVEAPGYQGSEKAVTLAGGDEKTVLMSLEVVRPARTVEKQTIVVHDGGAGQTDTWKWVGWGTTGLLAAGAVTTGIFGLNAASELEDLINTAGVSHEELESSKSRARRMFVASDILAAGALAAAGVSLYLTIGGDEPPQQAEGKVAIVVAPNGVKVHSTF